MESRSTASTSPGAHRSDTATGSAAESRTGVLTGTDPGIPVRDGTAGTGDEPARGRWASPPAQSVTVAELVAIAAAALLGVIATMSLAMAHLGVHGLGTVFGSSAVLVVVLAVLARLRAARFPRIALDPAGLVPAGLAGLFALWMFLPGFHYASGDKDPGGYVMHAFAIARDHSTWIHDPILAADVPVQLASPGARFPAVWISDAATGTIFPQFYHLWPALLATSLDVGGYGALVATAPLLGGLAVVLGVLIARRIGGLVAAWVVGALLATNMMEVWQAKYPTTEILSQALFLGALLGVLLAVQTGWRWPALIGGALIGVGFLGRADGLILVLLAAGLLAVLWVLRRFDARAGWFTAGLALVLPYGLWQAYGPAESYTNANSLPSLALILAALAFCLVGALILRPLCGWLARRVDATLEQERSRRVVGGAVTLGAAGLFVLGGLRPRLFGADYAMYLKSEIRTYDEINLHRLSWFFTWPGLALMVAGIGVIALRRRWSASGWLVLVLTAGLLTLYTWHTRNSPYFMWVGRRFVPTVVPGMMVLIGVALAAIWMVKIRGRLRVGVPVALALVAFIGAVQLSQSLPLRSHDEWNGTYGIDRSLAALSGGQDGVWLWQQPSACCAAPTQLFGAPIWLTEGQDSALLPRADKAIPGYVRQYAKVFADRPLFLVFETTAQVPLLPGLDRTVVARFAGTLPHWEESSTSRPDKALQVPYDFTVYRVTPTG
ncbi:MAG TPA: hypothetical protein VLM05_22510 [Mycobacteriales bacterium]|nr:hypothetical protein [Mycobacteriales bacterium]